MVIFIALIIILIIGIVIMKKSYDYEFVGGLMLLFSSLYLVFHILFWSLASYNYNVFIAKRQPFVETLQEARKNNNSIELAAIVSRISDWNQQLAKSKYDRTVFLLKDYTDKRYKDLQPIR